MNRLRSAFFALIASVVLIGAPDAFGEIVDRHPLADPRDELIEANPDRVVASGEMFLVHGQRITTQGDNLDEGDPIRGAEGFAVPWSDGWMIIRSSYADGIVSITRLDKDGSLESFLEVSRVGEFVDAASNRGRLAIIEKVWEQRPSLWVTVVDESGVVRRFRLHTLNQGLIRPFGDGFLVVSTAGAYPGGHDLHAWRLRPDGEPDLFERIDTLHYEPDLQVATNGSHAALTTRIFGGTVRIIGPDLSVTDPVIIGEPAVTDLARTFPLPFGEGFLVSYGFGSGAQNALVLGRDGTILSDGPAEPIVAGDRSGSRYLVLRPWGDAGLAVDDPRNIVEALQMKRRLYQPPRTTEVVVSGDVTLATFDYWQTYHFQQPGATLFIRFDEDGSVIDQEPLPFEGVSVFPLPGGFAFLSIEGDEIRMRRLASRGDWIDDHPISLSVAPDDIRTAVGSATEDDLLVAWATAEEIVWTRYDLEGTPLQTSPNRVPRGDTRSLTAMGISESDGHRLLLLYDYDVCYLSPCLTFDLFEALALDREGDPLGPVHELDIHAPSVRAVGLPDGTWAIPGVNWSDVVQLSRDGAFLRSVSDPLLRGLSDFAATSSGWRAISGSGLLEFIGLDLPSRLTGVEGVASARFGAGSRVVFVDDAPGFEQTPVPWNGRLEAVDGDLSIRLRDLGAGEWEHRIQVEVTNLGTAVAENVSISASEHTVYFGPYRYSERTTIGELAPGDTVKVVASAHSAGPFLRFLVTSPSIRDVNVENNSSLFSSAEPLTRRRTVGSRP